MSTSDNDEFFEDLIDYNDDESVEGTVEKTNNYRTKNLTFLEPNIDVNPNQNNKYYFYNFNNEKIKEIMMNSNELDSK